MKARTLRVEEPLQNGDRLEPKKTPIKSLSVNERLIVLKPGHTFKLEWSCIGINWQKQGKEILTVVFTFIPSLKEFLFIPGLK